jgi:HAE1 family hydrophobic/amphiphilic exporter-1
MAVSRGGGGARTGRTTRLATRLAAALAFAVITGAGPNAQRVEVETGDLPPRVGVTRETALSLEDAISQALSANADIAVARITRELAVNDVAARAGAFDPLLSVQTSFQQQVMPISSIIGGSASGKLQQQNLLFGPQISGLLSGSGTQYQAAFNSRRLTTDNQFVTLNPQFPSELSVSVVQPLFRGRQVDDPRRQLELARRNETLTDEQFRQRVMDIALDAELAYWDLRFANRSLTIEREGLALAREQVAGIRRLVAQGLAAPVDVLEAQTQVSMLEQSVYAAQAALTRAENRLKGLMLPDRGSALWSSALRPTTEPPAEPPSESLEEAVRDALASRPELAQTTIAASVNEVNARFLRDQTKPQIDLVGTYTSSGLAGHAIPPGPNPLTTGFGPLLDRLNTLSNLQGLSPLSAEFSGFSGTVPASLTGGVAQSLSSLLQQDFPTVEVGVRIGLPFRNRTAEARVASSLAERRRLDLERRRLEQVVEAEVRDGLQAVMSGRAALASAADARSSAEGLYASEQRQFAAGTSTVFLVLQRQTSMITSRTQHARAEVELSKSLARFRRATGQILAVHGITVR